ncbi:hypothetical protein U2F10_02730 [Leptothoe sp. EHU-05/26/07-4]
MKTLFAIFLLSVIPGRAVLAQSVTIHPANVHIADQTIGSNTAMCWIDFNSQGIFVGQPWCQVHLPARSGPRTNRQYLVEGSSAVINDRIPGQPGRAVCTVNFDSRGTLMTVPLCYRGLSGGG